MGGEAVVTLRLVTNTPARRAPPKRAQGLTDREAHRVAIALRNFIRAMGSRECAAEALDTHPAYFTKLLLRQKKAGAAFALRLARYMGVPLEVLLAGKLTEASICPTCGAPRRVA
jgi:hypothetical protein